MAIASFPAQKTKNEDDAKQRAVKRRLENDLISMEADQSKHSRNVESLELDLRTLQKQYVALGFEILDKQEEVKKHQSELQFLDEEIRALKKKINNL